MRIRMLVQVSGGRGDGTEWPRPGEELDVGTDEGRHLCAARLAVPVPVEERKVETPEPAALDVETREAAPKPRSTRGKN